MFAALARRIGGNSQSVGRLLIACMALGFASLLAAGLAAVWATQATEAHTEWVNHSYDVEVAIGQASILNEQAETTRRGYLLTGNRVFLDANRASVAALPRAIDRVARLTADNPRQQINVARLRQLMDRVARQRQHTLALVAAGRNDEAARLFRAETDARWMPAVRDQAGVMLAEERRLLASRNAQQRGSIATFYTVLGVAGVILLLLAIVSLLAVLRYTNDLAATGQRLHQLNDTLEDQVAERTADLSRANEEIQRFAYIVSHDLRSPLVNVMGFTAELATATTALAELVDRAEAEAPTMLTEEARLAAREDLPEAIGFIRTSTQKMDRLINAILKLSREGRRTVTPEPLDIAAIAEGAVAAIQHIVEDRGVTVTVERPMPRLVSDRLAIEQILSNLIENATKYLQPSRAGRVTISASEAWARVAIEVADNGRGIDPRDHQRIFDLFRRSGAQDQPGEGIGLAHVRALAYRLGGTIDVQSTLGEGATFRLTLPAVYQAPQEATA